MMLILIKVYVLVVMVMARFVVLNVTPWALSPVRVVQEVDKLLVASGV
jgi:hypothetical protein